MRIIKEYDERRNEILDTAERLFFTKGYEKCTVNDILREVAIAKGTFYYYFKSKEEVMDAVVARYKDVIMSRLEKILQIEGISPEERLLRVFMSMQIKDKDELLEELHKPDNALLHEKSLSQMVTAVAPVLVKVIEEGTTKKVWRCDYPLEYMQIFLASALTLTDGGIFELDAASQQRVMAALITLLEKMLEVPAGSFLQLMFQQGT